MLLRRCRRWKWGVRRIKAGWPTASGGKDGRTVIPETTWRAVPAWAYGALAAAAIALQVLAEHLMGHPAICTCGYVKLWEGDPNGPGTSQHLTDWYTFSHLLHGFLFYLLLWLVGRRWPVGLRFLLAVLLEVGWEVLENSDFIIMRYRANTISLDYYGDSILNSVSDTVTAVIGYALAAWLRPTTTVVIALAIEIGLAVAIRDNLLLNIVMLIHNVPWIEAWQAAGTH
jgi:hypothetical protein